jgi:hypothetical protein
MKTSITSGLRSGYYKLHRANVGDKKVNITVVKRFHEAGKGDFFSKWIDRAYFRRNFPNLSEQNHI